MCNIYIRYFSNEAVVTNLDQLLDFLAQFDEINLSGELMQSIQEYWESTMPYPKRFRVRQKVYFLLIKTAAATLEDFKSHKMEHTAVQETEGGRGYVSPKEARKEQLSRILPGWYYVELTFRRVVPHSMTGKAAYVDTPVSAYVYDESAVGCYKQLLSYLQAHPQIDIRSQFPSSHGDKFYFEYCGATIESIEGDIEDGDLLVNREAL